MSSGIVFDTDTLHTALVQLEHVTLAELAYIIRQAYQQMQADVCYLFLSPVVHGMLNELAMPTSTSPHIWRWETWPNQVTGTTIRVMSLPGFPLHTVGLGWFDPKEIAYEQATK